jgi:small subunit ribosomal protein S16
VGSKKNAMWRVVVADQRSPRDGRFIEMIGHYNPQTQPSQVVIDRDRLDHWLGMGAVPTNTVRKLMRAPNTEVGATSAAPPATAEESPAEPEAAAEADAQAASEPDAEAAAEPDSELSGDEEASADKASGDDEASGS